LWFLRRVLHAIRRLHTDMPLGSVRSSGSAVRFPVITTLLMFVAATVWFLSLLFQGLSAPLRVPQSSRARRRHRAIRRAPIPLFGGAALVRGRAKDVVPIRRGDAEAARLVLKMMAHVALAQHPPERAARAEVMQVVVRHVVDEVA